MCLYTLNRILRLADSGIEYLGGLDAQMLRRSSGNENSLLKLKNIIGSFFAMVASNLPEGKLLNYRDIEDTPWDQNLRIKHFYGE